MWDIVGGYVLGLCLCVCVNVLLFSECLYCCVGPWGWLFEQDGSLNISCDGSDSTVFKGS